MAVSFQQSEAVLRGTRMLRTALGPAIAGFLEDPSTVEVMLNPDGRLWIDRLSDGLADTGERLSPADGERIVRLVAHHVGAEVHAGSPRVSAELPGTGERFEGLLPPVVAAPTFAIRKPAVAVFGLQDYVAAGIMTADQAEILRRAVADRRNILVAGGTSTGKTTLTNALLAEVSKSADRVVVIGAAPAVLAYLFHRIEDRLDGRPTLLIVDEGWLALDDEGFAGQLREWLKTLRKKNASVVFATQSLSDIDNSPIAPAIIESCPTRLLLPNERAIEPQITTIYRRFGLNDRQIEILARAVPKRDYYCQSRRGNRLFELGLSDVALALCAASSKTDQAALDRILAEHGRDGFLPAWLRHRGVEWAADLIPSLTNLETPS